MTPGPAPTRRRVLAAGMLLLPRAARAQTAKRRRIAYLATASRSLVEPYLEAVRQGLRALGYRDEDIEIETRYADGQAERLPGLAAELVRLAPEVIVAGTPQSIYAAKQATMTIPIVMAGFSDPVANGVVASLAHPGGNITGLTTVSPEMAGKWLQLLKTAIPDAGRIAFLSNPSMPQEVLISQAARQAARALRIELLPVDAHTAGEIDGAFAIMAREHAEALTVIGDPIFMAEKIESSSSRRATSCRRSISSASLR